MCRRELFDMKHKLVEELTTLDILGDWSHVVFLFKKLILEVFYNHVIAQIGMFSFTRLTPAQHENIINKWQFYMFKNGRISMTGINTSNLVYVARATKDSVENH